ncbi:MAG: Diphthine synthase [Candidatus Methanofastidiosum methylothiophilum]|uniref:Diphthine synthase n=1 Tax=Candidatus Methanofastidiosum methylothiophilum TaxID=1705564 RepID=A0A150IUM8_9EURY|nr:MAG: Diphthine synthase [Candidatus Methanofastidiosum methylthiophilus]KYC48588.1 MAG: Diphthine synthase [Candidatus Methanofastidiosum methylthiophilus]KYC51242.1 MAG: Diphthine synthase [Candidatus Methanofastidiosum methylthiophilus]
MLYLIGLGLSEKEISLKAFELLTKIDNIYLDTYTNYFDFDLLWLENSLNKKVSPLSREDIEKNPLFLETAKKEDVALLVSGDPLVATTHTDILLRANKKGIQTKVLHSSSIYSAIAETGLHIYRFGKTASIPYPEENFFPRSFYDVTIENKERNLHTMLLLDVKKEKNLFMNPKEAIDILKRLDENNNIKDIVVISRISHENQRIIYGDMEELAKFEKEFYGPPPHTLVIPAELHFAEEEYLLTLAEIYKNSKNK